MVLRKQLTDVRALGRDLWRSSAVLQFDRARATHSVPNAIKIVGDSIARPKGQLLDHSAQRSLEKDALNLNYQQEKYLVAHPARSLSQAGS